MTGKGQHSFIALSLHCGCGLRLHACVLLGGGGLVNIFNVEANCMAMRGFCAEGSGESRSAVTVAFGRTAGTPTSSNGKSVPCAMVEDPGPS